MRKRLHESCSFRLLQETSRKGRRFYRIVWWNWFELWDQDEQIEQLRDLVDPQRNKSGPNGISGKFTNRAEAEQMYAMLLLRWA